MPSLKVTMEDNRQKETPREQNQGSGELWTGEFLRKSKSRVKHGISSIAQAEGLSYFFLERFPIPVGRG